MSIFDIVGYTYKAQQYTPEGVIAALATGPGQDFDGWALGDGVNMSVEDNLNELAAAFGIDRADETSFDTDYFPKVVLRINVEDDEHFENEHGNHVLLDND
ncbi:hypothetical protein SEA_RUDY_97 [Microbacterium phage Rudy]|nr:hypothetical protein SEA_RUDY_97 [Microbacterium phage Rudy]QWY80584.1 hypothetical protein SEA_QUAMMI_99 [Microbacterium phage Quammi]UVG33943.1 hypothetical protein SEA_VICEROY_98 [Microbacterium phage Viceroy]UVG34361.1 hypothetical protein SEA_GRASSBOY_104 [Microbacterium phage Grassboy]UVG35454.1 hypothetical protein SEA_ZAGIE_101 [Microbacterium phage Zagie]WNM75208.1 hypothetical protein SEA_LONELYSOIL_97 [Microbacterium phage Lonelysoil]